MRGAEMMMPCGRATVQEKIRQNENIKDNPR